MVAAGPASFEFAAVEGRAGGYCHGLPAPEVSAPMPGNSEIAGGRGRERRARAAASRARSDEMETTLYAESAAVVKRFARRRRHGGLREQARTTSRGHGRAVPRPW